MVEKRRTVCLFCSLGCGLAFRTDGEHIIAIDYDKENPVNKGSLCPRGHYNLELINHPQRLTEPRIGNKKVTWDEAISYAKDQLKKFDPGSMAISLSSIASNEDAYIAAKFAEYLGTKNILSCGDPSDIEAYEGNKWKVEGASYEDVEKLGGVNALLIIGDILTRSPVLSKRINQIKYGKRGNQIIVIDPNISRTSWFATMHLKNRPGTEAALMAGILKVLAEENKRGKIDIDMAEVSRVTGIPEDMIVRAAKAFDAAEAGTVIFAPNNNIQRNDLVGYFVRVASSYSLNKKHLTFYSHGNALGVNTIIDSMVDDRAKDTEKIKALLSFGEDCELSGDDLNIKAVYFAPDKPGKNTVILPLASHMERKGSAAFAGRRIESFRPLAHKIGGRSSLEIISSLMDARLEFDEILEETSKVLAKKTKEEKADLKKSVAEALSLTAKRSAEPENITRFGNNRLVGNFFWYRVNNG